MDIECLDGLSVRSFCCLYRAGIRTVEDLKRKTDTELLRIRNFGPACLENVREALESVGITSVVKTNADRIRSMSDEELAEYFGDCLCPRKINCSGSCDACIMEWLSKPAED